MSLVMTKPAFSICENKLISVFVFATKIVQSTAYIRNFKPVATFYGCTVRFVSDLVGNPEDRFYHNEAHIKGGHYRDASDKGAEWRSG